MLITFLLVNFNMKGLIEQCINSIDLQITEDMECEILIADNSSNPEFAMGDDIHKKYRNVHIFKLKHNKGWINALNYLFPHAKGDSIFIIHPDIEFEKDCIRKLISFYDSHPEAGIISPNMTYPDGSLNKIRLRFPSIKTETKRIFNILTQILIKNKYFSDEILWDRADNIETDMVMSVCLVIRKDVLRQIKEVPENLKIYYSNDFLCMKAKSIGYKVFYVKDAVIVHYERFANTKLYSSAEDLKYKKTALPITDKMEKDRFTFLRYLLPWYKLYTLKFIATIEFSIHLMASIKQMRKIASKSTNIYLKTIAAIWSV